MQIIPVLRDVRSIDSIRGAGGFFSDWRGIAKGDTVTCVPSYDFTAVAHRAILQILKPMRNPKTHEMDYRIHALFAGKRVGMEWKITENALLKYQLIN